MAGHSLKSTSITNWDASPVVPPTTGEGGAGVIRCVSDYVTPVSSDDNTSTYRLVRIPTTAKIKAVYIESAIASAGAGDIDIAFSDSLTDGTQPQFTSLTNPVVQITGPADNKLFGSALSLHDLTGRQDITYKNSFLPVYQNTPLWSVLVQLGCTQFAADPGGMFDLYVKVTTTITTGGVLGAEIWYVE